jgi:hypothetical protein
LRPQRGGAFAPLLACSPPTESGYQSAHCSESLDYQFHYFVGGGLFIFVIHITPPFCIYYNILLQVCQEVFGKKFNFFLKKFLKTTKHNKNRRKNGVENCKKNPTKIPQKFQKSENSPKQPDTKNRQKAFKIKHFAK